MVDRDKSFNSSPLCCSLNKGQFVFVAGNDSEFIDLHKDHMEFSLAVMGKWKSEWKIAASEGTRCACFIYA